MKAKLESSPSRKSDSPSTSSHATKERFPLSNRQPRPLRPADVLRMQRVLGNNVVSRIIQRKPADVDLTWTINYDNTGTMTNAAGVRATMKRATIVNAQMRDGWVTPNEQLHGGHLFKKEFGGPDDETNVVPWRQAVEDNFSKFEDDYQAAADSAAKTAASSGQPYQTQVKTKARFVDRPDLKLTEGDLDAAGWTKVDPDRALRKAKYDAVAENFSGIPTGVTVDVTLPTPKHFEANQAEIAPGFVRNPDAIKPGYAVPSNFVLNPSLPRDFVKVDDWKDQSAAARKQLQHTLKHDTDFNLTKKKPVEKMKELEGILEALATNGTQISGVYRKSPVVHYVDAGDKRWLCTTDTGALVAAFKLNPDQYLSLTTTGLVK